MTPKQQLDAGIAAMGLNIDGQQREKLLAYTDLLKKWNKTYNLTALRDDTLMVSHHLLDSLTLLPHIAAAKTMADVGSGGGQPGIPTAICRPDLHITLIDANTKKTAFLRQAAIELELDNVHVVSGRVEAAGDIQADVVTSRAFAELSDFIRLTHHMTSPGGFWAAMKGVYPEEEIAKLPEDVAVESVQPLHVPGLQAERHIVIIRKKHG